MAQRIKGVSRILAVASGKGGVGKTTVAVNLALALALDGTRVGLFDGDIYGPNVPLMLGLRRAQSANIMLPIARAESEPYIKPVERYGLKVISVGFLIGETDAILPDPQLVGRLVPQTMRDVLWGDLDYLVVDLPPGTGEPQQSLVQAIQIDGVVVVTTPQDLSLLDAGRSLGLFRQAHVPILGVIENMSHLNCPHCGERIEVFHHSDRRWAVQNQALELLGRIPMDTQISAGIDAGDPLVQAAPGAAEVAVFREIAARVSQKLPSR